MMQLFDTHTHTNNSPDSPQTIDELCTAAISRGVEGIAITDHAHLSHIHETYYDGYNALDCIRNSLKDAHYAAEKYRNRLKVFCGVEIGEVFYNEGKTNQILNLADYDVIICSIHHIKNSGWDIPYSRVRYDESVSDEEIIDVIGSYFQELKEIIRKIDFDILAHLTCPIRYTNEKWNRNIDIGIFEKDITDILNLIIEKDIALEINTAYDNDFYPNEEIIRKYYDLGGRLVTLGSDAHRPTRVANKFEEAIALLKKIGFGYYCYYENRSVRKVNI